MILNVKMYGRRPSSDGKLRPIQPFSIDVSSSETVISIKLKIQEHTNVPANTFSIMTIFQGSSTTLNDNKSISDYINSDEQMLFAIVLDKSVNTQTLGIDECKIPTGELLTKSKYIAKAHYKPSINGNIKTGEIVSKMNTDGKPSTVIIFDGIEYTNAKEWISKAFNNSGKECSVKIQNSEAVNTPRPILRRVSNSENIFGNFC